MTNKKWAENILKRLAPHYKPRWEVYEKILRKYLNKDITWLDLGCGNNADVEEKKPLVKFAAGVDMYKSKNTTKDNFVISDISYLPFQSNSVDVISLRFVIEHIENPKTLFNELKRVLRPNGVVVFVTTNILSPVIFLPKLLPYNLRKKLMLKLFNVEDNDIFPTYHRFNSYGEIKAQWNSFKLESIEFIQDLNTSNRMVFILFLMWHFFTNNKLTYKLRSNFIAVFTLK